MNLYILKTDKFRLVYDETQVGAIYIVYKGIELIIFKLIFRLGHSWKSFYIYYVQIKGTTVKSRFWKLLSHKFFLFFLVPTVRIRKFNFLTLGTC